MALPTVHRSMNLLEWTLLLTLSVLWGGSFFFVGVAVIELPPLTIVALRVGLAALALHLVLWATGAAMPSDRRAWLAFAGMGLLNNVVPFSLIVWGQSQIGSGLASILNATTPLFTVLAAHALTADERLTGGRLAGVLAGLAGIALLIGGEALSGLGAGVWGQLACLAAAASYALAGIFGRRFKTLGIPPLATAAGQVTASCAMLLPLALLVDRPWTFAAPSGAAVAALLGLALLSTALAYVLYFRILATAGATNLLLVTFLIPVTAVGLGVTLLGERLEPGHLLGGVLIGLGLAAIDGRPARAIKARLASSIGSASRG